MMIQRWYKENSKIIKAAIVVLDKKAVVICDEVTTEFKTNDEYEDIPNEAAAILENLGYVSMGLPEEG